MVKVEKSSLPKMEDRKERRSLRLKKKRIRI